MATGERAVISAAPSVLIEAMTEHDLLEVCAIEDLSGLSAWGWDAYHKELESVQDTIMLVARVDSTTHGVELAGFIVARLLADELHVNNVAVRPAFRRHRIGSSLLEKTLQVARGHGANMAHLEVRAGNEAAQRLYAVCGFRATGRRKAYYRAPVEDAILMTLLFG